MQDTTNLQTKRVPKCRLEITCIKNTNSIASTLTLQTPSGREPLRGNRKQRSKTLVLGLKPNLKKTFLSDAKREEKRRPCHNPTLWRMGFPVSCSPKTVFSEIDLNIHENDIKFVTFL